MGRILAHKIGRCVGRRVHERNHEPPSGAFDKGPSASICFSSRPATADIALCAAIRVSGSEFVGYAKLCQGAPFFWIRHRPLRPVLPHLKVLLTKFCSRARILHRGSRHLCFQFEIELIEEVRFGFEVGEQRSIGDPLATPASLAMPAVGALRPCVTIKRVAASRIALLFSSLFGRGIKTIL